MPTLELTQTEADNLVLTAKNAGVPKEQIENFVRYGYVPLPWQWKFHSLARLADKTDGPTKIGCGGARGPGKSHAVFAQVCLDDCQRVKGLKGLFLRQTGNAARESFEDLIGKVLAGKVNYQYNGSTNTLSFVRSGSRVLLGGFHDERDIDKYIGIEYDFIAIEELNQLLADRVNRLLGSMRTSKSDWRPRLYTSFNPGGVGHQFVKELFVLPYQNDNQKDTRFVPATYKDNRVYLNKEYVDYLENLEGNLGKAWREGNFDIFEGQYFNEWNREKHTVPPFQIPVSWKRFRAYDHGRTAPACCKWYALDYDGRVWAYKELYLTNKNVDEIASEIKRMSEGETYEYSVADPSIFAHTGFVDRNGGQTIAESFSRQGVDFYPASNRRIDGWSLLHQYLFFNQTTAPRLIYFNTCYNSIRTIPSLVHDERKPEDLDTKGEDHAADVDRYFLLSLHERKPMAPINEVQKKLQQMKEKEESFQQIINGNFYSNGTI